MRAILIAVAGLLIVGSQSAQATCRLGEKLTISGRIKKILPPDSKGWEFTTDILVRRGCRIAGVLGRGRLPQGCVVGARFTASGIAMPDLFDDFFDLGASRISCP